MKTKKLLITIVALMMCVALSFTLCACNDPQTSSTLTSSTNDTANDPLWSTAIYSSDTTIGEGEKTIKLDVVAGQKSITLTINTDAITLEDALKSAKLIEGEESEYGFFIKKVNGIEADFDKDQTYWAISQSGEYMSSGVSTITIKSGDHYELKRTK